MTAELIVGPTTNGHSTNGFYPNGGRAADTLPSAYLQYLPAIYWDDPFIGRFLRIFEDILSPLQTTVDNRSDQFDASLAPPTMLHFLATWVGADELGEFPEEQMRRLVKNAVLLHQLRGTKEGLRLALQVVTNRRPYITEYSPGLVLGEDAVLGLNTSLQTGQPLQVHIVFNCQESETNLALVHDIIRRYKPAGTVYTVSFVT
ncbi:MAG TPA: phage tail protein [Dehalococcoidia bacterium]